MLRILWLPLLLLVSSVVLADPSTIELKLNQIQVIGTHNSYHIAPSEAVLIAIGKKSKELARSLDYTHRPLVEQFSVLGIRQIELDIFADPKGGLYAEPGATKKVPGVQTNIDPDGQMKRPGMKVFHVQDVDYRSTVPTLVAALKQIQAWLRSNPRSCPIMVMLELKHSSIGREYTQPHPFGQVELDAIDREILSVFKPEEIILPDDVRGKHNTLRAAILNDGWPTLESVRGKVMFAMDNQGSLPTAYLQDHAALRNRVLFVSVPQEHPAAAFMKINNPIDDFETIQRAVKQGFLVRTRADAGTKESRLNDTTKRDQAFASGAHFVSTDYREPDKRFSDYHVVFDNNITVRTNPVTGPAIDYDLDHATKKDIQRIAHRGGVVDETCIENSIPAIEEAIKRGYAMLEIDLRESKDGHIVVHHDGNFRRFYSDSRRVTDLSWNEIQTLRSTPGALRPLNLEEFALACKGKIQLMLDTKGADHDESFFAKMEQILVDNNLLAGAFVIGSQQAKNHFHGKAKIGINRNQLETAIKANEKVGQLYFLFEHGDMSEQTVALAQNHGVQIVPSINVFHYPKSNHQQRALADFKRLRRLGIQHFQIDSVYDSFVQ